MKVIVQVPCLNEEKTLGLVLDSIPKKIPGVDEIEVIIIDDGSTDKTVAIAKAHGVKHIVYHVSNRGLVASFRDGVNLALELGADILVNTDGDNQYPQARIGDLVQPIIRGEADIVIADRQTHAIEHFSSTKKFLQKVGTGIVNFAAGTDIPDAASGFRAYSKESLLKLNYVTSFSYAMETIIQAGNKRLAITSMPIDVNPVTRESRLFKSMWSHVYHSGVAISRAYVMYRPYTLFVGLGIILLLAGAVPFIRFLILQAFDDQGRHIQSLILGTVFFTGAFLSFVLGVLADLIRINRRLHEETLEQIRTERFK
ncbi:MAG: glycosyltransferase family 2 protein [Microcoleus sp.]